VMTLLFQPLWGMLVDRFQAPQRVLAFTFFASLIFAVIYPFSNSYWAFLILFTGMTLFESAGVPIMDSIAIGYVQRHGGDYGSLRLWGAIGFAVASWAAGLLSEWFGLTVIFWIYAVAMVACVLLTRGLPHGGTRMRVQLTAGLKTLFRLPRFTLFLVATFLVFGSIQANNTYYGIFFTEIGGTVAGVGLSFLIAAGCEAPVMRFAGRVIRRFGLIPVMATAGLISALRWLWYGMEPSVGWVMALLFVQGLSVGLYLPAATEYVREIAPPEVQTTAMALYSAIGNGLGAMAGTLVGGLLLDRVGIFGTYQLFGTASLVGVGVMVALRWLPQGKEGTA
jgi:PPP family 3-phenylpropionic acid transporter